MKTDERMKCPDCEYNRARAANWRAEAYKLIGHDVIEDPDKMYDVGWNSALEMAATLLVNEFKQAFGADTLTSVAAYIKELKK